MTAAALIGHAARPGSRIMTIARDGQPRSLRRTASAIQSLSPGYFPFVMAAAASVARIPARSRLGKKVNSR